MRKWIVTFFGTGFSPVAPGTAGSLLASVFVYAIFILFPSFFQLALIIGLFAVCAVAIALGDWAAAYFGRKDPQPFVLDEVAGIFLTNLFLPPHKQPIVVIAVAFAAFRLFDVTKPPPARQLERLPGGWGILMDDLAAAVYANLCCQLLLRLV